MNFGIGIPRDTHHNVNQSTMWSHVEQLTLFASGGEYEVEPFIRFVIQLFLVIFLSQIIRIPLNYLKQPRVISEMLAGILLGSSGFGMIPGFSENIFTWDSLVVVQVCSSIGLCSYLFLVGMQIDFSLLIQTPIPSSSRSVPSPSPPSSPTIHSPASSISEGLRPVACSCVPRKIVDYFHWGLRDIKREIGMPVLVATVGTAGSIVMGFPVAAILFSADEAQWCPRNTPFVPFSIFLGVGMGVPALSVVPRILAERSMLHLPVGAFTITSAVVALLETWIIGEVSTSFIYVNYYSLSILWNILIAIADFVVLFVLVRPLLVRIVRKVEKEQELSVMNFFWIVVLVLAFSALAEYTTLTASLGAMLVGMTMPRRSSPLPTSGGDIVRKQLADRLEDIMSLFFLPLFMTFSGLRTRLGDLLIIDVGICILIFVVSFFSKVLSCFIASHFAKLFPFREAVCYGVLMQAKGLMALIIFNNALNAGIITSRMFSLMVVFVMVSTIVTTPIIRWILPKRTYIANTNFCKSYCALVCPQTDQHGKAMASLVAALLGTNRIREHAFPDRIVAVKLLKDTQRSAIPFMRLSLMRGSFQKTLTRRDPILAAVRKRLHDINIPNNLLHNEQMLHVTSESIHPSLSFALLSRDKV